MKSASENKFGSNIIPAGMEDELQLPQADDPDQVDSSGLLIDIQFRSAGFPTIGSSLQALEEKGKESVLRSDQLEVVTYLNSIMELLQRDPSKVLPYKFDADHFFIFSPTATPLKPPFYNDMTALIIAAKEKGFFRNIT